MKTSTWAVLCAILFTVGLVAERLHGQDVPRPGKQHDALKQMEGTWDAVARFAAGPGKPMAESKGVETATLSLGGFWLIYEYKGERNGQPFTGRGSLGYDQQKQKYICTWIDSSKSGLILSEGTADDQGKVFTMLVQGYRDAEDRAIAIKQVMEIKDKDSRKLTLVSPSPDGKDVPVGTIEYTRRK